MIFTQDAKNSDLSYVIISVNDTHISMTKSMTCRKKPEISGFFATQIQENFLKKWGMTLRLFRPLAGFEPIQDQFKCYSKDDTQANLIFFKQK